MLGMIVAISPLSAQVSGCPGCHSHHHFSYHSISPLIICLPLQYLSLFHTRQAPAAPARNPCLLPRHHACSGRPACAVPEPFLIQSRRLSVGPLNFGLALTREGFQCFHSGYASSRVSAISAPVFGLYAINLVCVFEDSSVGVQVNCLWPRTQPSHLLSI